MQICAEPEIAPRRIRLVEGINLSCLLACSSYFLSCPAFSCFARCFLLDLDFLISLFLSLLSREIEIFALFCDLR